MVIRFFWADRVLASLGSESARGIGAAAPFIPHSLLDLAGRLGAAAQEAFDVSVCMRGCDQRVGPLYAVDRSFGREKLGVTAL